MTKKMLKSPQFVGRTVHLCASAVVCFLVLVLEGEPHSRKSSFWQVSNIGGSMKPLNSPPLAEIVALMK